MPQRGFPKISTRKHHSPKLHGGRSLGTKALETNAAGPKGQLRKKGGGGTADYKAIQQIFLDPAGATARGMLTRK